MKKYLKNLIYCLLIFTILICPLTGCEGTYYTEENSSTEQDEYKNYEINSGETDTDAYLEEDGSYTTLCRIILLQKKRPKSLDGQAALWNHMLPANVLAEIILVIMKEPCRK